MQRNTDLIRNTPGLIGKAADEELDTPGDAFNLFLDDEMLAYIVEQTNKKIQADVIDKMSKDSVNVAKDVHMYKTDLVEIRSLIGLMLYR